MEPLVADEPIRNVVAFATGVDHLSREVHALRKTSNPQHLPAIKDVTQRLVTELASFASQWTTSKRTSEEHEYLMALTKDCEHSGLQFLAYLHSLVAHTRAIISHASHQAITVSFDWKYVQNLLDKLKTLRAYLEETTARLAYLHIPKEISASPHACINGYDGSRQVVDPPRVGPEIRTGPPLNKAHQRLEGIAPLRAETQEDYLGFFAPSRKDVSNHKSCSLSTSWQEFYRRTWILLNSEHSSQSAQIFRLSHKWNKMFHQQAIPAVLMCYALESSDVALSAPVNCLHSASNGRLLQDLEQHIMQYCGGLFEMAKSQNNHSEDRRKLLHTGIDRLTIEPVDQAVLEILDTIEVQKATYSLTDTQGFDPLRQLASACLMVMKSADPSKSDTVQRYLMYLAHILRHATHFNTSETQQYLNAIAQTMSHHQAALPTTQLNWYLAPQPLNSLHQKPELRVYSGIRTFAAREGLRMDPHTDPSHEEGRHRFAITAYALSSWSSRLQDDHPLKIFEPCLERRIEVLTYLLLNLTPPESTVCGYNVWMEAVRLCNTGTVAESTELLAIFIAASRRPDLLWNQIFGPSVAAGYRSGRILHALRDKVKDAVAPDLLMDLIARVEKPHLANSSHRKESYDR